MALTEENIRIATKKLSDTEYELDILESHTTIVTFKTTKTGSRILDEIAKSMGMTKSELIRVALSEYLRKHGVEVPL